MKEQFNIEKLIRNVMPECRCSVPCQASCYGWKTVEAPCDQYARNEISDSDYCQNCYHFPQCHETHSKLSECCEGMSCDCLPMVDDLDPEGGAEPITIA